VTDPDVLSAAVIGCGGISHEHLSFLSSSPRARLVAVCDRSPALAALARERYGAERAVTDAGEMLATVPVDVVHVLTPPNTHVPLARLALEAGAHVICEKPLAPSATDTEALLRIAADRDRSVVESRNYLFNDVVLDIDRRIRDGQLGDVREVDVTLSLDLSAGSLSDAGLRLPGGAAHDFLPHMAAIFLHLVDHTGEVDVVGTADRLSSRPDVGIDHVDVLVTAGRRRGRIRISPDVTPDSFRVCVRGTEGAVEADLFQPYVRHEGPPHVGKRAPIGHLVTGANFVAAGFTSAKDKLLQHTPYHGVPRMLDAVYHALASGTQLPIRPSEMYTSAVLIDQIIGLADRGAEGQARRSFAPDLRAVPEMPAMTGTP
jgi:predicted dehydrogenase